MSESDATEPEPKAANGTVEGAPRTRARQRALAIGVLTGAPGDDAELGELGELLRTAGVAAAGRWSSSAASPIRTATSVAAS